MNYNSVFISRMEFPASTSPARIESFSRAQHIFVSIYSPLRWDLIPEILPDMSFILMHSMAISHFAPIGSRKTIQRIRMRLYSQLVEVKFCSKRTLLRFETECGDSCLALKPKRK